MAEYWDDKFDLLDATRSDLHNEDYWRFLVREVWRIDRAPVRIADFGCGFGWVGLFLTPMLAPGSLYAGIDRAEALLSRGRALFAASGRNAWLARADACAAPFPGGFFDVAIAHTLLMHLPEPEKALAEMIRVTREGGLVIVCDASRNAINALIHVHETSEQDHTPLAVWQAFNAAVRRRRGVDYNIGMKTPVLMREAGLTDVEARVSDAVRLSCPPIETPAAERQLQSILDGGLGTYPADEAALERDVAALVGHGMPEADARAELRREMASDYRRTSRNYHIVQPGLMTISYGRVRRA
jgi:SAM-dependent methyltransferase